MQVTWVLSINQFKFEVMIEQQNFTFKSVAYNISQVGGRANVKDELLCRFIFPERPGALMKFLDALSPRWNITLFHYRGQVLISNTQYCSNQIRIYFHQCAHAMPTYLVHKPRFDHISISREIPVQMCWLASKWLNLRWTSSMTAQRVLGMCMKSRQTTKPSSF